MEGTKMSEKKKTCLIKILGLVLIAVVSIFILAQTIPKSFIVRNSFKSLDKSKNTVMAMTGVTLGVSSVVALIPGQSESPVVQDLVTIDKYLVFILVVIYVERMIAVVGPGLAFRLLIPAACVLGIAAILFHKKAVKKLAVQITILGLALAFVIPVGTSCSDLACGEYLKYVDTTISSSKDNTSKIKNNINDSSDDKNVLEKIGSALQTAANGVANVMEKINNMVRKFINSVAILLVSTFLVPLIIAIFFVWLLKQVFNIDLQKEGTKVKDKLEKDLAAEKELIRKEKKSAEKEKKIVDKE